MARCGWSGPELTNRLMPLTVIVARAQVVRCPVVRLITENLPKSCTEREKNVRFVIGWRWVTGWEQGIGRGLAFIYGWQQDRMERGWPCLSLQ